MQVLFAQGPPSDGLSLVAAVKNQVQSEEIPSKSQCLENKDSLLINKSKADLFAIGSIRDMSCLMILDAHFMESQHNKLVLHYSFFVLFLRNCKLLFAVGPII